MRYFIILILITASFSFAKPNGHINGRVIDAQNGEALAWVDIYIKELGRSASTLKDGRFSLLDLPEGEYTLEITRVGYDENHLHIHIENYDTTRLTIQLIPEAFQSETIVIEDHRDHSHLQKPEMEMSGKNLRRNLGVTIAETIGNEPGLDQQTNGPAPARPVLRGLSGDRLLLLENGGRTGDLSTSSSDHAVTIEPITAERIEVIRGPKTLEYGTNTLSGVINVIRHTGSLTNDQQIHGNIKLNGESVNQGAAGAFNLEVPYNDVLFYFDGSYRNAGSQQTPLGKLKNTYVETINGKGELNWFPSWGIIKSGFSVYSSDYGIPPAPEALSGHPDGIDIEMDKQMFEGSLELNKVNSFIRNTQLNYDYTNYKHNEFSISGLDAAFTLQSHHLGLKSRLDNFSVLKNISVGAWSEYRVFQAGGRTNTVDADELTTAAFMYQENDWHDFKTSAALRIEQKRVLPKEKRFDLRVGNIRDRIFTDYAASLRAQYSLTGQLISGLTLIRAFRAPGIEELFSDGPHLASYSYEVGNANLDQEQTYGAELSLDYEGVDLHFTIAAYYNQVDGYLFPQNTGLRSWRRNDLFRYRIVGLDAVIRGIESTFSYKINRQLEINSGLSYLHGDLLETYVYEDPDGILLPSEFTPFIKKAEQPLPFMPPFKGNIDLTYKINPFSIVYSADFAARQNRPGEFESETAGYLVHNLNVEYFINAGSLLHTFSLSVENLTDVTYRRHLNRIKEIFPEAGRNVKLLYKLFF